jgi:ABC-2 type transport system permease protein
VGKSHRQIRKLTSTSSKYKVISSKLVAGKPIIHILSDDRPRHDGFRRFGGEFGGRVFCENQCRRTRRGLRTNPPTRNLTTVMFKTFFSFELKSWLRSPMPWIFLFIIALLCFFATISDQVSIGGGYGNVWKNAPFVAQNWYGVFSLLSILLTTAFLNSAGIRDFERQTSQIIFSKPVGKASYYFGHFWGALLIALVPMFGISVGMWAGMGLNSMFDWLDANRFGPFELNGHLMGVLVFALPNTIFAGGILYAVAINSRSTLYSFVAATTLLVGYIAAGNLMQDIENEQMAALLDPFGFRAFSIATKYWTVDDKNTLAHGLTGILLLNRAIWTAVGLIGLYIGYRFFHFGEKSRSSRKQKAVATDDDAIGIRVLGALPRVAPASGLGTTLSQLRSQFKTEFMGILRSTAFILLTLLGLLNCVPNLFYANESYGTHELPVTYTMIEGIRGSFYMFIIIIMVYFSGAVIWKERNARMNEIIDACPPETGRRWLGKFGAVLGTLFVLQVWRHALPPYLPNGRWTFNYNVGVCARTAGDGYAGICFPPDA